MTFMLAPNFEAPSGDPSRLAAAAAELADVASLLDGVGNQRRFSIADQIGFLSDHRDSFIWEGSASTTFGQFIQDRTEGVQQLSGALGRGALALAELAVSIAQVQQAVATVESIGQERAAQASQLPVPVTPNALYGDLYGMVSTYEGIAEAAKDDAAATFRALLEAAPHYVAPEPKPASPPKDNPWWSKATHTILDAAGQVPVIGEPANLVDAGIYLAEGDKVNAAISASGAVPFVGNVTTGARMVKRVDGAVDAVRHADDVGDVVRRADDVPTSAANGGAGRVPPVAGTGDAGHKWPKRQPDQPDGTIVDPIGPTGSPNSGTPTGWTGTPNPERVEDPAASLADVIRKTQLEREAAAQARMNRPPADG